MNDSILLLALLYIVHILGDFYCQPTSWVKERNDKHLKSFRLYQHVLIHAIFVFIVLCCAGYSISIVLYGSIFILLTHFIIDIIKSYLPKTVLYFFIDQAMHIIMLTLMWSAITGQYKEVAQYLLLKLDAKFMVVFIAYILILKPTAIIIKMLLEQWSEVARSGASEEVNESTESQQQIEESKSLVSAGKIIGMVERVLILTFVLLNQFAGVGFLLAAKSVFRFGDLKESSDHKMTEYVMLGTLLSVAITVFVGIITLLIIKGSLVTK